MKSLAGQFDPVCPLRVNSHTLIIDSHALTINQHPYLSRLQDEIIKEFAEEIRKLKAVIVKHEGRIRVLESAVALQMKEEERNEKKASSPNPEKEFLASDEV